MGKPKGMTFESWEEAASVRNWPIVRYRTEGMRDLYVVAESPESADAIFNEWVEKEKDREIYDEIEAMNAGESNDE